MTARWAFLDQRQNLTAPHDGLAPPAAAGSIDDRALRRRSSRLADGRRVATRHRRQWGKFHACGIITGTSAERVPVVIRAVARMLPSPTPGGTGARRLDLQIEGCQ
jgi:hypothetical protein